ncbi:YolD-like family protein [Paenibacillus brevis]|uniref:YolD-like family protein n=1 Tax=Paenibacillus brevis TaxID=2841508 RepID=A0ABS6FJ88_9BACL|nr:YolD-like family protein [Paenibacillus brevis]MBU5670237.1 YolD-like family protein [Paenibacillus brevis]
MSKLDGNVRWQSKLITPEFAEALRQREISNSRRIRPHIDDQLAEQISRFLIETHRARQSVSLRMFDEFENARVVGIIERLDTEGRRFMVDGEWFIATDILEMGFAR